MKTFKFSLVLCTREKTDVFITLDDNIYGIHSKRVNILYVLHLETSRLLTFAELAQGVVNVKSPLFRVNASKIFPFTNLGMGKIFAKKRREGGVNLIALLCKIGYFPCLDWLRDVVHFRPVV